MQLPQVRSSLRAFLLAVTLCGLALGVVRWNTPFLSTVCGSILVLLQCTSIVGSLCQREKARIFWIAVAVFSIGYQMTVFPHDRGTVYYLPMVSGPNSTVQYAPRGPAMLVDRLFSMIEVSPKIGDVVSAKWQSSFYPATINRIGDDGRMLVAWADGHSPTWVTQIAESNIEGRIGGQAIMGILIALLAGSICQNVFGVHPANPRGEETREP